MWYGEITKQLTNLKIKFIIEIDDTDNETTIVVENPDQDLIVKFFDLEEVGEGSFENEESDNFYFEEGKLSITQWIA